MRAPPVAVPAHKGRGTADAAPGPCCPRAMRGLPPRLPRLLRRMGASRRPAPQGGARSAGRAHSARFLLPPCGCGCAACRGFLPAPPRPSPSGPRGARGHDRLRAGTGAAHTGPRPSTGPAPSASAVGRARHTRGSGFLRVAAFPLLTSCPVSDKIPLRGHTGSVRSAALHVHGATKPPVFDGGLLLYLGH